MNDREVNFNTSETLLGDINHNINLISGWPWVGISLSDH